LIRESVSRRLQRLRHLLRNLRLAPGYGESQQLWTTPLTKVSFQLL